MQTQILKTDTPSLLQTAAQEAARLLRAGQVAVIPTETVYGLAADALSDEAVKKIFQVKGRPSDNPLIVHIESLEQWPRVAREIPESARILAERFWPGPLTMVLPKQPWVPPSVCAGLDTVGVRMPSHPVAREIIRQAGTPLAAPSANLSGRPSATDATQALEDFDGRVELIVDGGSCPVGVESTVICFHPDSIEVLRPGLITPGQLSEAAGLPVCLNQGIFQPPKGDGPVASPGMKYKHYSPKAEITIIEGDFSAYLKYLAFHPLPAAFALCFEGEEERTGLPAVTYGRENDPESQAEGLFAALRRLDRMGAKVAFARDPGREGVAAAVYNRLLRAAGFRVVKTVFPYVVGVTGPTGAGKGTFCALTASLRGDIAVLDADRVARGVAEPGSPCLEKLAARFGEKIRPGGVLDRKALARAAFADRQSTDDLNAITHPFIRIRIGEELEKKAREGARVILLDAPTLFESGSDRFCDMTLAVLAPDEVRLGRISRRDGLNDEDAAARMKAQQQEAFFRARADHVVVNDSGEDSLARQAEQFADELKSRGAFG